MIRAKKHDKRYVWSSLGNELRLRGRRQRLVQGREENVLEQQDFFFDFSTVLVSKFLVSSQVSYILSSFSVDFLVFIQTAPERM